MNRRRRVLSLIVAVILSIGFIIPVQAASITDAQKKAAELEAQKKAAEAEKSDLATQLNAIITSMQKTQTDMAAKEEEISVAEDELVAAKIEENNQYESMKKRIKYMYENGDAEFIELLITADSISDLLNKAEYVTKISEYDRKMLVQFQDLVKDVSQKEASLKTEYTSLETMQNTLISQQGEVETLLSSKNTEISNLQSEIGANSEVLAKLIADAQAAARKQKEAAAASSGSQGTPGSSVISGNGQLTHPCPGSSISSTFGPRWGTIHKGIDFAAPSGTPIYAADSGTVVTAGWSSSAGNWVVINHGNGLSTKYMHMVSTPYVSTGESVSRGQNIGAVGTTGNSTGNHLHFQVEIDGVAVDPAGYL